MKAALLAQDGSVLFEARRPTGREHGTDAVVAAILDFAADLADEGRARYGVAPLAVPGTIDERNGIAVYSANIGWRDLPLRKLLGERLAAPRRPGDPGGARPRRALRRPRRGPARRRPGRGAVAALADGIVPLVARTRERHQQIHERIERGDEWKHGHQGPVLISAHLRALHEGARGPRTVVYRGRQLTVDLGRTATELFDDGTPINPVGRRSAST